MSNTLVYELRVARIATNEQDGIQQVQYVQCAPPARLCPKGTIVLLHDFFRTSYQFRYVVDLFAMGGYHVLAPDLPPRSTSPLSWPDSSSPIGTLTSCVAQFLHSVPVNESVHLVGCGFGAQIAVKFSLEHPEKVASLTYGRPVLHSSDVENLQCLLRLPISSTKQNKLVAFKQFLMSDYGGINDTFQGILKEDIDEYVDAFSDLNTLVQMQIVCQDAVISTNSSSSFSQMLPQAKRSLCHIMLLQTDNDIASSKSRNENLTNFDSHVTVKHIEGSFTSIPEEQPEHFAVAVLSFLHSTQAKTNALKQALKSSRL